MIQATRHVHSVKDLGFFLKFLGTWALLKHAKIVKALQLEALIAQKVEFQPHRAHGVMDVVLCMD